MDHYGEESIYNLIPQRRETGQDNNNNSTARGPRYKSKHANRVKESYKTGKKDGALLGKSVKGDVNPKQFLKKGNGIRPKAETAKREFKSTKPAVPRHNDRPVMGLKSNKDYVKENRVEALTKIPKKGMVATMQDGAGARFPVEESGLVPKYSKKKDFGKTPEYLLKRKEEEEQQRTFQRETQRRTEQNSGYFQVPEEERLELLRGLKTNFDNLQREYQGLPVMTDTGPKKAKRNRMEAQLAQLESDIEKLENHAVIYVADR